MLADTHALMNYHHPNMTTAAMQPLSASISLPPISSIDFHNQQAHHNPPDVLQPQPPRQLPPLPQQQYYNSVRSIPQEPQYVQPQRAIYPGMQMGAPYGYSSTRIPLPSTADPNLIVAQTRHKTKEVKRRTKTGCMTCRKRRIKCDEARPECRNCMKSKRQCLGYDPSYHNQSPHSIAPSQQQSNGTPTTSSIASTQPQHYHTSSPSAHNHSSITSSAPHQDFSFSKPPDLLPTLNQPYRMDHHAGMHHYPSAGRPIMATLPRHQRTMEEICTIPGTKVPSIPAIPPDSVPNLESIRKVYDIAFAPGLDKLLESSNRWYTQHGFDLLASNRNLLGLMLAYLTLVSNNHDSPINHNPTLVSQEARVTWAMLSLCTTPTPSDQPDDEADILARRFRAVESILTGEPLEPNTVAAAAISMSEFVHQEPEDNDPMDATSTTIINPNLDLSQQQPNQSIMATAAPSPFARQVAQRTLDFWSTLENIATSQPHPGTTTPNNTQDITQTLLPQLKSLLDGKENRDILYSSCLLGWGVNVGDPSSERELGRRFLQNEAGGRAAGVVLGALAGMSLRALDPEGGGH